MAYEMLWITTGIGQQEKPANDDKCCKDYSLYTAVVLFALLDWVDTVNDIFSREATGS